MNTDGSDALADAARAVGHARRNAGFRPGADQGPAEGLFFIAVGGAAVFAVCTIASSFAVGWVIDNVIMPRFEEGEVAVATVLTGIGMIIGIGIVARDRCRGASHRMPAS